MRSRLFQSVREERGAGVLGVHSSVESYRDTGMRDDLPWASRPRAPPRRWAGCSEELARFAAEGPTAEEIDSGKAQIKGAMLLGQESVSNHMYHLAHRRDCATAASSPWRATSSGWRASAPTTSWPWRASS